MVSPQFLNAPIILLKEDTDVSQGKAQIIGNINACEAVVDLIRTTLGPRGMDKLIYDKNRSTVTITNDGATVMELLNIVHPAAKILCDIAKAQDEEVGDGTTSVVIFANELLQEAKKFIEEGVVPQVIIKGYQKAACLAQQTLSDIQVAWDDHSDINRTMVLQKCAETSLNSKLVSSYRHFFGKLAVDAVLMLDPSQLDKDLIGIKKVTGGSATKSILIDGVAFKKTFSYAGFEQQPKYIPNAKVMLLNIELELKAEKENAEVRIENPDEYQAIVEAEWKIIYNKLDQIAATGAQVILSRLPIGDLATQYFADRGIFCAGRVEEADMLRTVRATGAQIQTSVHKVTKDVLGVCGEFSEMQIGNDRYNIFKHCPHAKTATIILRGGAQQFIDEAERSLNDAIMVVRRVLKTKTIVGGGGAIEMELSRELRSFSRSISGKQQLIINSFAKALEAIPRTLAHNAGLDQVEILNKLRQKHYSNSCETRWLGVDCINGGICDTYAEYIWEPSVVKLHCIKAATEAACVILSIDDTIQIGKTNPEPQMPANVPTGRQRGGRPLR